jgi:hypothetical protein
MKAAQKWTKDHSTRDPSKLSSKKKSAGDQAWCPENVGKCLAIEPYTQSSGEQ